MRLSDFSRISSCTNQFACRSLPAETQMDSIGQKKKEKRAVWKTALLNDNVKYALYLWMAGQNMTRWECKARFSSKLVLSGRTEEEVKQPNDRKARFSDENILKIMHFLLSAVKRERKMIFFFFLDFYIRMLSVLEVCPAVRRRTHWPSTRERPCVCARARAWPSRSCEK